jgi:hypothetical protein
MFDLAAAINMPASFVALRHAIVHEGYSGLKELRRSAHNAMHWLWYSYWRDVMAAATPATAAARGDEDEEGLDPEQYPPMIRAIQDFKRSDRKAQGPTETAAALTKVLGLNPPLRHYWVLADVLLQVLDILDPYKEYVSYIHSQLHSPDE